MIVLTRTQRIDWLQIVLDLRRAGLSRLQIASRIKVPHKTLVSYLDDRCIEPAFWVGSAMLGLWSEVTGRHCMTAPTRIVLPTVAKVLAEA